MCHRPFCRFNTFGIRKDPNTDSEENNAKLRRQLRRNKKENVLKGSVKLCCVSFFFLYCHFLCCSLQSFFQPFGISLVSLCSLSLFLQSPSVPFPAFFIYIYIYMDEVPVFLLLHVHSNLSCFSVFGSIIFSHLQILLCRMHVFFLLAPLLPSLSFWLLSLVSLCLQPSLDRRG